ncbi:hypothetical protein CHS0354_014234 [Potamilus streckersoni]|nr:hypothetical protein CHS0354_014234 [Potamilus streckersoni]
MKKDLIQRLEETVVRISGGTSASKDQQKSNSSLAKEPSQKPPVPSYRGTPPVKMRIIPDVRCMADNDYNASPIIADIKKNENLLIPPEATLSQLTFEELSSLYHSYIERPQFLCPRKIRMGLVEDGGWFVCDMEMFKPKSPCVVYSAGINHDFSFDDDVIKYYGCEVHSFDPSMKVNDYRRNSLNYFHNIGISGTDSTHGWRMMTLGSIKKLLNHSDTPISILKADIEMSEWTALSEMIQAGALKQVRQLSIEFHLHIAPPIQKDMPRDSYLFALNVLRDLYTIGFRIFWTTPNYSCVFQSKCRQKRLSNCQEVNFVNVT